MSARDFVIRPARTDDLPHLYEMAKLTGGGFTNLPPDRQALSAKLERSAAAFAREAGPLADELFVLVLENVATREVRGTCQLFTSVGQRHPFYSYRLNTLTQHSRELGRTFKAELLSLTTDLEGSSEVGGLGWRHILRGDGRGVQTDPSRPAPVRRGTRPARADPAHLRRGRRRHGARGLGRCLGLGR